MTEDELARIHKLNSVAIIAPAGHGKTEMIVDIVENSTGKQLLLTHTNAGVDALEKRLKRRKISKSKYYILTIAAFCIKWCISYNKTAQFDISISPLSGKAESKKYFDQLYAGTKKIFSNQWAGSVLINSYSSVIVDEYQDCTQEQHEIILAINVFVPVRVLGDPLQGIFSFAGTLVDWRRIGFEIVDIDTKPWRWKESNPVLGEYLTMIRKDFLPILQGENCNVHLESCEGSIEILNQDTFNGYELLKGLKTYKTVLYISKWENEQIAFCNSMPGIFQVDEKQECNELFAFAKMFENESGCKLALSVMSFASKCVTSVNSELNAYKARLEKEDLDFSKIKKNPDFGVIISDVCQGGTAKSLFNAISWFGSKSEHKMYRAELFEEMLRSLKYADFNSITIFEAVNRIRKDITLQKRYSQYRYLASRTVLSKGLEFNYIIIDMRKPLTALNFYVAMTRAMKKIYIIASSLDFQFSE